MGTIGSAIIVKDLHKSFTLPHEQHNGIKQKLVNIFNGKRGFETQKVLNGISFEVKKGEFFGIVGRNGSGKSTLLKLLAGIYAPDKGLVQVAGSLTPFIELGVGFNPELTGRENVFLNGALLGISKSEMEAMYDEIVEFAELDKFMDQKLKNYSSGMQVRLAFSIAIRARSDILVLDEVLAVGDQAFQRKCYEYFSTLKEESRTVVLVTHDMGAVRQYCTRGILLEKGTIKATGKPERIAQAYQKLFSVESKTKSETPKDHKDDRWGNGRLKETQTTVGVSRDTITITTTHTAHDAIKPPVLGFTVFDSKGLNILESSTVKNAYKTQALNKGESITLAWSFPNVLRADKYRVSVACCDQSLTEFYDWHNTAAEFTIRRDKNTAGAIDPTVRIK